MPTSFGGDDHMKSDLRGKDMVTLQEWEREELESTLDVADILKREWAQGRWDHYDALTGHSLFMLFYNTSTRTRNSFEAGIN
ncbi:MAG: hypothetical protein ACOCTH_01620, partial [Halodesulfurarchaeum sp.]